MASGAPGTVRPGDGEFGRLVTPTSPIPSYPALALDMARLVDRAFPPDLAAQQDELLTAYERRLLAAPTGLIDTFPTSQLGRHGRRRRCA